MNLQTCRTLLCVGAVLACVGTGMPLTASGAEWEPGHSTTSVLPGEVSADDTDFGPDGVYGRFDGDLDLALSAGAELESGVERVLVAASAHYYWTAGVYTAYREAVGDVRDTTSAERLVSLGVDVRPMFWLMNTPVNSQSRLLRLWWRLLSRAVGVHDRLGFVLGAAVYPVELTLVRALPGGPSTRLMTCRKR